MNVKEVADEIRHYVRVCFVTVSLFSQLRSCPEKAERGRVGGVRRLRGGKRRWGRGWSAEVVVVDPPLLVEISC